MTSSSPKRSDIRRRGTAKQRSAVSRSERETQLTRSGNAERVTAYRERMEKDGYRRAEIEIPQEISQRVSAIAKEESLAYTQVLSSLAQLGLTVYDARRQYGLTSVGAPKADPDTGTAFTGVLRNAVAPLTQNATANALPASTAGASLAGLLVQSNALSCSLATDGQLPGDTPVEVPSALAQAALSPIENFFRNRKKD